jgi:hypothetical protein
MRTYVFHLVHEPQITLSKKRTYIPISPNSRAGYQTYVYILLIYRIFRKNIQERMVLHMYIVETSKIHVFCIYKNIEV